jgi:hypothetical protein
MLSDYLMKYLHIQASISCVYNPVSVLSNQNIRKVDRKVFAEELNRCF